MMRPTFGKLSFENPLTARTKSIALGAVTVLVLSLAAASGPVMTASAQSKTEGAAGDSLWTAAVSRSQDPPYRWCVRRGSSSAPSDGWTGRRCPWRTAPAPTPTPNPTPAPTETTPTPTETSPTPTPTPTPTEPTPSPTTSAPPGGGPVPAGACARQPSSCGFPDETNTGVGSAISLRTVPGDLSQGPGWSCPLRWVGDCRRRQRRAREPHHPRPRRRHGRQRHDPQRAHHQ